MMSWCFVDADLLNAERPRNRGARRGAAQDFGRRVAAATSPRDVQLVLISSAFPSTAASGPRADSALLRPHINPGLNIALERSRTACFYQKHEHDSDRGPSSQAV